MSRVTSGIRFFSRPVPAAILVTGAAFLFAAAATAAHGFPPPLEHDEFSYILGAETFKSGHLTNPTHPMWRHFETFHVLQQPTYNSKYPPANALVIAAGWAVTGRPIAGVWLSFAFMCVAMLWLLRAWLGPRWGLGISLAFTSWIALSYWSYSYWGGALAAGAGALVLGGVYRIVRGQGSARNAIALGLGLVLLANSRPYEGLLLAIPVLAVLGRWLWRNRGRAKSVLLSLGAVGVAGLFCMGTYNRAVTGSWHKLPYTTYQQARGGAPLFIWQQPYHIAPNPDLALRSFMAWEDSTYRAARTVRGRTDYATSVVNEFGTLVVPLSLLLPLLLIPIAMRSWWIRFAVITTVWTIAGMSLPSYFFPHYAAPLVGLILVVYGDCLRWLSRLHIGRTRAGHFLAAAIVCLWFLVGSPLATWNFMTSSDASSSGGISAEWPRQRQFIADTLSQHDQRNVVIVRYGSGHGAGNEWVYNAATIDASPVVWARDLGDAGNQPLVDYFRNRAVWIVEVNEDTGPYTVRPYLSHAP